MPLWDKRRHVWLLAGLLVFHVLLISVQVPRGAKRSLLERAFFFVLSPVQRAAVGTVRGLGDAWRGHIALRGVRRQNEELRREVFFLRQESVFLRERLARFRSEREVEGLLTAFKDSLLLARVIGVDSANPYRSIVIDKGRLDGLAADMPVCDRLGRLVGRTVEPISLKESKVQLVTDKDSSVSVVSAVAGLTGSMTGRSEETCDLRYVLASSTGGEEGEELLTTGFDRIYPPGLPVGRISKLEKDETSPLFRKISVQPHFRFNTIDVVAVIARRPGGSG